MDHPMLVKQVQGSFCSAAAQKRPVRNPPGQALHAREPRSGRRLAVGDRPRSSKLRIVGLEAAVRLRHHVVARLEAGHPDAHADLLGAADPHRREVRNQALGEVERCVGRVALQTGDELAAEARPEIVAAQSLDPRGNGSSAFRDCAPRITPLQIVRNPRRRSPACRCRCGDPGSARAPASGAGCRDRTDDLPLTRRVLYQLS